MKILKPMIFAALTLSITGCMTPIGKEEFTCPNQKKGGICGSPRDIHALLNGRENLENLDSESAFDGYIITVNEDGDRVAKKVGKGQNITGLAPVNSAEAGSDPTVYEPREHTQQNHDNYQPAKVINQVRNQPIPDNEFSSWPRSTEPLAPEPLAVIEPPKVMRVLIASYKDHKGNLNMPGYVYVQVEPETWSIGEAANLRPQRVVPTQIREKADQELNSQKKRSLGVSPIETTVKQSGG